MIDFLFDGCVTLLLWISRLTGLSYEAVNVWLFCILGPAVFLWLVITILRLRRELREVTSVHRQ